MATPRQLLPTFAYHSAEWFEREQQTVLGNSWTYVGVITDFQSPGDYAATRAGHHPLFVLLTDEGELRAYHNICRHRGTELVEGSGNLGSAIVCPYHRWNYRHDGTLRGMPGRETCFPGLDTGAFGLHPASVREFGGVVFVHPDPEPEPSFETWLGPLADHCWPHDLRALVPGEPITYEIKCNWKVYFENAVDGYHLAYLHENTLGGPLPWENVWDHHGDHLVWYSTEIDGKKRPMTAHMTRGAEAQAFAKVEGIGDAPFGGVYMIFPTTIVSPKPYGIYISQLVPLGPELTLLHSRKWNLAGEAQDWASAEWDGALAARDPRSGRIKLELLDKHPLETGAFRMEDMWICEKIQRAMHSPRFSVGALAAGEGAETPIMQFQQSVLRAMEASPPAS